MSPVRRVWSSRRHGPGQRRLRRARSSVLLLVMVLLVGLVAEPVAALGWPSTNEANQWVAPYVDLHGADSDGVFLVFNNPSDGPVAFEYRRDGALPPPGAEAHPNPCAVDADPLPDACDGHAYIPSGEVVYDAIAVPAHDAVGEWFALDESMDVRLAIGTVTGGVSTVHGWEFDWTHLLVPVPPSAPRDVTATPGDEEVTVRWRAPEDPGNYPPIDAYVVEGESAAGAIQHWVDGTARSAVITGLSNATTYTFWVLALPSAPCCAFSSRSQAVTATPGRVPSEPLGITATAGFEQATFRWEAPDDPGTSPITGYAVTSFPGGPAETVGPSARSVTIEGLSNNETFTFQVQAGNLTGWSATSWSVEVTPGLVPGAPIEVNARSGDGEATISWRAPEQIGTSAITGYHVTSYPGGPTQHVGPLARSTTIGGLSNDETFTFRVQAGNRSGWSATSAPVTVTPGELPSVVQVLGGPVAVSEAVLDELEAVTGVVPMRLAGADRYATAAAIVADAFPWTVDTVYVATGTNFPDALAGAAGAAARGAPVLLVGPDGVPEVTATQLTRVLD